MLARETNLEPSLNLFGVAAFASEDVEKLTVVDASGQMLYSPYAAGERSAESEAGYDAVYNSALMDYPYLSNVFSSDDTVQIAFVTQNYAP